MAKKTKKKRFRFESLEEVAAIDAAPIIRAYRRGLRKYANELFDALCLEIRDLPQYEAFMLARKVVLEADKPLIDPETNEVVVLLANGCEIRSGWTDQHDPGKLPAGDYIKLLDPDGKELLFHDASEWCHDGREGRRVIGHFLICCASAQKEAAVQVDRALAVWVNAKLSLLDVHVNDLVELCVFVKEHCEVDLTLQQAQALQVLMAKISADG